MNADDQNLTQPENRENDDDEQRLASEPPDEESGSDAAELVQPPDETSEESAPDEDVEPDAAEPIPPVSEMPVTPAPNSAAPPRIVSETPLGGTPRPHVVVNSEPSPGAPVEKVEVDDTTKEIPPRHLGKREPRPPAAESVVRPTPVTPPPEAARAAATEAAAPVAKPAPEQPPSRVTHAEPSTRPDDWADEDISPELAAVLFGERRPAAETPSAPETPAPAPAPAKASAPEIAAEPPAEAVALTDENSAHRLRLTAEAHSAAAPEVALQGKVRYVRIEEPLNNDKGQRVTESWRYFKPDYPSLEGRLVKAVESMEIQYADGSWYWKYERRYSDGGRDRREVRANTDRSYVERHDEVSKLAAQAGKRVLYKEAAAMILTDAEREEKRSFLSGLLGREDSDTADAAAKAWRDATTPESRHARKNGGEALRRRFLGIF
jgi:hypothetical protein